MGAVQVITQLCLECKHFIVKEMLENEGKLR